MRNAFDSDTALGRWAVDQLIERYVAWREECHAVWATYQGWVEATPAERPGAYAGYVAALDREEQAARTYANHIERFSCVPDDSETAHPIRLAAPDDQPMIGWGPEGPRWGADVGRQHVDPDGGLRPV